MKRCYTPDPWDSRQARMVVVLGGNMGGKLVEMDDGGAEAKLRMSNFADLRADKDNMYMIHQ